MTVDSLAQSRRRRSAALQGCLLRSWNSAPLFPRIAMKPHRLHPAHPPPRESRNLSIIVFVTVCTKARRPLVNRGDSVAAILQAWEEADAWLVGRYTVLPDHVHLFCAPARPEFTLRQWVKYWKARASFAWSRPEEHPLSQDDFWDTQLRRGESYSAKWEYVRTNPVRHGLVSRAEDWPWAGEIHQPEWHEP